MTGEIRWWLLRAARAEEGLKDPFFLCLSAWVNGGVVVQQGGTGGADEGEVGSLVWVVMVMMARDGQDKGIRIMGRGMAGGSS